MPGAVIEQTSYIIVSDIYALSASFLHPHINPLQSAERKNLTRLFSASHGFGRHRDADAKEKFDIFLLLNVYDMLGIENELKEAVNLAFINPKKLNNYNISLVVNPPLNNLSVDAESIVEAPRTSPKFIPRIAKSEFGDLFILDLGELLKNYEQEFLKLNNLYSQYYP